MELTMKDAIWQVMIDIAVMGGLLLIGEMLRANLKILQKLLIPPAVIAGFLALFFGPKSPFGMGVLPLSGSFGTYASVLIVLVFAATPLGDKGGSGKGLTRETGGMFFNITGIAVLQYAAGLTVTLLVLQHFYPAMSSAFGLMMATGFYGGHGTAASVGANLENLGIMNMTDLGNTCATIGIVGGILTGMIMINWGTRAGHTRYVDDPKELPLSMRTGLIPKNEQASAGKSTINNICLDQLGFHLGLVLLCSFAGYELCELFKKFSKSSFGMSIEIPAFCLSLIVALIMNMILNKTGVQEYVDRPTIQRIQGTCTDFLMISGIGSMNTSVVMSYAIPLVIICALGFFINWIWFFVVGSKCGTKDWFERNMMVWGHATGVAATGVLLQRVVDPDLKSRGIEDSGIADVFNRPIIIGLQIIPPMLMFTMGDLIGGWASCGISWAILIVMWIIAYAAKWWVPGIKVSSGHSSGAAGMRKAEA